MTNISLWIDNFDEVVETEYVLMWLPWMAWYKWLATIDELKNIIYNTIDSDELDSKNEDQLLLIIKNSIDIDFWDLNHYMYLKWKKSTLYDAVQNFNKYISNDWVFNENEYNKKYWDIIKKQWITISDIIKTYNQEQIDVVNNRISEEENTQKKYVERILNWEDENTENIVSEFSKNMWIK